LTPASPVNPTLDRLTGLAVRLVGASLGQVIVLSDAETLVSAVGDAPPTARRPAEPSLARSTVTAGQTMVPPDSGGLGAPLRDGEGRVVGALCVYAAEPRGWSETDLHTVQQIAAVVAAELERVSHDEPPEAAELRGLVALATDALSGSLEIEDAARQLARLVVPALADWSVVTLVGRDAQLRALHSWHHDPAARPLVEQFAAHRFPRGDGVGRVEQVRRTAEPVFIEAGLTEQTLATLDSPEALAALRRLAPESGAALPLMAGGLVVGVLTLARGKDRPSMSQVEVAACLDITRRASTVLETAQSFGWQREMAEQLQRSLLSDPVQPEAARVAVRYVPAAQSARVGGDWYDAFLQPDGAAMLVIGDVVGHDSASAAAMGQLRGLLRGIAYSTGAGPAEVLTRVDEAMDGLRLDTTATAVVARVERDEGPTTRVRWSNAGHPPPVLLRPDGRARLLRSHDLLLGITSDEARGETETLLEPGVTLLMYTDGLIERRGEPLDIGLRRLLRTVRQLRSMTLETFADALLMRMLSTERDDDVALLALRVDDVSAALRSTS
jgi:serine phosphatase RsbU (regulator of sigma subunit)